jgi:hypothetical protein
MLFIFEITLMAEAKEAKELEEQALVLSASSGASELHSRAAYEETLGYSLYHQALVLSENTNVVTPLCVGVSVADCVALHLQRGAHQRFE